MAQDIDWEPEEAFIRWVMEDHPLFIEFSRPGFMFRMDRNMIALVLDIADAYHLQDDEDPNHTPHLSKMRHRIRDQVTLRMRT